MINCKPLYLLVDKFLLSICFLPLIVFLLIFLTGLLEEVLKEERQKGKEFAQEMLEYSRVKRGKNNPPQQDVLLIVKINK